MGSGHERQPQTEAPASGSSTVAGGVRDRRQDRDGNAAVAAGLSTENGAGAAGQSWRERGNLIGNPPVRSEAPPNSGIIEDGAEYRRRLGLVKGLAVERKKSADGMLDSSGKVVDNRFWFTRVYQYVTENEVKEAESGTFWYPSYVLECVRYFDKVYEDNLQAADRGGDVEAHWQTAFDVAADKHEVTLLSLAGEVAAVGAPLVGASVGGMLGGLSGLFSGQMIKELTHATESLVAHMQAHIRFDLPRAQAWVFSSGYKDMDRAAMADFSADFMSMTSVFDQAAIQMSVEMGDRVGLPAELVPRMVQDFVMAYVADADMATERADTWQRAIELTDNGLEGRNPYTEDLEGNRLMGDITGVDTLGGLQQIPSTGLRPSMEASAPQLDDDASRTMSSGEIDAASSSHRIRMIRGLVRGVTFDGDEDTVLSVLGASVRAGDLVAVVDAASAWDICYALDGKQYEAVRQLLIRHYYPHTARSTARTIVERCMRGMTLEWEERMIADIITCRPDRRSIVEAIGQNEGGGRRAFTVGRDAIYANVDWSEQDDVERVLGQ